MIHFPGKLALQQRVLPNYRVPFFDLLASACEAGMSLFAGSPRPLEGITTTDELSVARYTTGRNIHIFNGSFTLYYQPGLVDWLRDWNPDALIVEANSRDLSTASAIRWMHGRGRPVIGWGLGSPPLSGIFARYLQSRRLSFLNQFDALIAYSRRGAEEYAQLGFPKDRIFVAPNAVSPPPAFPLPVRSATFNGRPYLLFVGRLQARKRIDHLLKACAQLESQPRLVVIGEGPERRALELLAQEIYPSAEFIGARHGTDLKPYFTEADLFVLPGTGGLAIQEAMSYGLPVIVAQGDGTQDDLVQKGNGWQIPPPPGDFGALVSTLKEALSDVARLRRMGTESYRIVKEEINIEKMVKTFVQALSLTLRK
ncbi:MAG TPA: glycosyltransferase family 4 protein [Anaerolineales bacterium]|nr:glycosyltransferase family 4 protein [Anaerolineales bacterium]